MPAITVYIDDSAEERRRRRRRIIEIVIILLLLGGAAAAYRPKRIVVKEPFNVIVPQYYPVTVQGPDPPPRAVISPSQVEFESLPVGSSVTKLVTVRNDGGYHLDVALDVRGAGFGMTDTCRKGLNEREVCAAEVVFAPRRTGRHDGALTITSRRRVTTVALSGSGEPEKVRVINIDPEPEKPPTIVFPRIHVSPRWPDVNVTIPVEKQRQKVLLAQIEPRHIHFIRPGSKRVVVSNPYDEPIHIHSIVLEGDGYELRGDEDCKTLLRPGERCAFSVVAKTVSRYAPTARLTIR